MKKRNKFLLCVVAITAVITAINLVSCATIPKGAIAVKPFYKEKYLGTWYEIARMDFKFERGLDHVTATYSLSDENTIRVDNKGYSAADKKWKESIGKAKFAGQPGEGRLKVSFFGPFYAGYNVIAIDPDYKYALVAGNNLNYLWLLSRYKNIPQKVKDEYLKLAQSLGYRVEELVWTNQEN